MIGSWPDDYPGFCILPDVEMSDYAVSSCICLVEIDIQVFPEDAILVNFRNARLFNWNVSDICEMIEAESVAR